MRKIIYVTLGWIGVILGGIGIIIPLLPTVPFFLLSLICFSKGSKTCYKWFMESKLFKNNLELYILGFGMTKKLKYKVIVILTLTMGFGFIMMWNIMLGQLILFIVWVFHIYLFFYHIETLDKEKANFKYKKTIIIDKEYNKYDAKIISKKLSCNKSYCVSINYKNKTISFLMKEELEEGAIEKLLNVVGISKV